MWVYQTLLPSLWNRYDVIECKDWSALGVTCDALGGDEYYTANVVANPAGVWRTFNGVAYGSALATTFGADGTATATVAPHFTVVGDSPYTIVVEATGYVHCNPVSACE